VAVSEHHAADLHKGRNWPLAKLDLLMKSFYHSWCFTQFSLKCDWIRTEEYIGMSPLTTLLLHIL